jgi:hypothetical protein
MTSFMTSRKASSAYGRKRTIRRVASETSTRLDPTFDGKPTAFFAALSIRG